MKLLIVKSALENSADFKLVGIQRRGPGWQGQGCLLNFVMYPLIFGTRSTLLQETFQDTQVEMIIKFWIFAVLLKREFCPDNFEKLAIKGRSQTCGCQEKLVEAIRKSKHLFL